MNGNLDEIKEQVDRTIEFYDDPMAASITLSYEESDIPFNEQLLQKYYEKLDELYPDHHFDISIHYKMRNDYILDSEDCKKLEQVDEYLRNNKNSELIVSPTNGFLFGHGFRTTLSANRKLDGIAEKIKKATNDGEPLSTYEKFMMAYEYVTNYAYNEGGDVMHNETSHWIPVLEGDKIVCAGYASLLRALCERIFDPNEVKVFEQGLEVYDKETGELRGEHANNLVYIKDEKYGIKGMFYADACWDCIDDNNRKYKPQAYCCIPLKDVLHNKVCTFNFDPGFASLYLHKIDEYRDFFNKREYEKYLKYKNSGFVEVFPDGSESDKFELDLDEEYEEKSYEQLVEDLLLGMASNRGYAEYYNKKYGEDIIKYDTFLSIPKEVDDMIEKHMMEFEKEVRIKYSDLLEKYSDVKALGYLPDKFIEKYNIGKYLDKFDNPQDEKGIREAIIALGELYSGENFKKILKRVKKQNIDLEDFGEQIITFLCNSEFINKRTEMQEKYKTFIQRARESNASHTREIMDEMIECSPVPLEAFINSYKIIGKQLGLEGKELREYVENRINISIERTNENFDIVRCSNCFAIPLNKNKEI